LESVLIGPVESLLRADAGLLFIGGPDPGGGFDGIGCMVATGWMAWRLIREWRFPYVRLGKNRLTIFQRGRPWHYLELAAIASVRQGFNRTVLLMRDGMKIPISHWGFMFSDDARHIRQALLARLGNAMY
jgi:hypothetical protein